MSRRVAETERTLARPRAESLLLGARSVLAGVWVLASLLVLIPVAVLARPFDPRHRVYDRCARVWARGILLLMGIRVVCRLPGPLAADEPYVVAANHQGVLDIPALLVALPASVPVRFVAKRSLFSIPILGWGMRLFGHVPVDHRAAGRAS